MERKWSVMAYKEGDEEGIFELWKAVYPEREYNREKWMRWWRWMYKDNPFGNPIMYLAQHDGRIVGHQSLIFMEMKIGNEMVKASQAIDLLVHPDYRYQGIFLKLERSAFDEAKQKGVHITIGFPNEAAYPGHMKLNWFDVAITKVLFKPLNWENAIKLKTEDKFLQSVLAAGCSLVFNKVFFRTPKAPTLEDLNINQTASFDDRINDFWAKVSNQYQIMVARGKDYLNWRYGTLDAGYSIFVAQKASEICGYLVIGDKMQNSVKVSHVFDLLAQSEEIMHCLVSKAIEDCQRKKVDLILYTLIANKTYHRVLKRSGFISLPFIKGGHFCAYSSSSYISKAFLGDPENWLVQVGDSDFI